MSIENLIENYLKQTKICAETDYAEKKSVRKHNSAVHHMDQIVSLIAEKNDEIEIKKFAELLYVTENKTNVWVAVDILKKLKIDKAIEKESLRIIKQIADGNDADALGFQMWLKNYENEK